MIKKSKRFVLLFVIFIFIYIWISYKFYCIENATIDRETNTRIMYTTKDEIYSLLLDNQDFFDELISQLIELDGIEQLESIFIPFDNERKYVSFYGLTLYYDIDNDDKLSKNLKFLADELNIHSIHVYHSANKDVLSFLFTETVGLGNMYLGLKYNKYDVINIAKSHYNVALTFADDFSHSFEEPISGIDNWYYCCSRDLDTKNYSFWYRFYDIVKGNLSK